MVRYSDCFDLAFPALKTQVKSVGAAAVQISWVGKLQIYTLLTNTGLVHALLWKKASEREG